MISVLYVKSAARGSSVFIEGIGAIGHDGRNLDLVGLSQEVKKKIFSLQERGLLSTQVRIYNKDGIRISDINKKQAKASKKSASSSKNTSAKSKTKAKRVK